MIPISLNVSKQSTRKFVSIPGAKKKGSEVNFEKSARKVGNMELSEDRKFTFLLSNALEHQLKAH